MLQIDTYTSRFLLTCYVHLILHSTTVATASCSTVEGTMRVLWGYSAATACTLVASQPSARVMSEYPHSILNGTVTCSSHSSTPGGGGVSLHMTGYAPAYTKSVEKGSFLTYAGVDVFCKKGIIFAAIRLI